jgi:hypothetical protein
MAALALGLAGQAVAQSPSAESKPPASEPRVDSKSEQPQPTPPPAQAPKPPSGSGEQRDSFEPSEKIRADSVVSFPVDI